MIGNKSKTGSTSGGGIHNTLSIGTTIKGDLILEVDLRLDGSVEGNIKCGAKIVIGPQAVVKGNIEAVNAEISGRLEGNIFTSERLILGTSAQVEGDIYTHILEVEPNARFNGVCHMTDGIDKEQKEQTKD